MIEAIQPKIQVLVVEDEPLTRQAICLALTHEGLGVFSAGGTSECRSILKDQTVDVVVLDLGLPDGDGVDLARELRILGDLGVVVVTRRNSPEARIEALDVGADDYLVKPVHFGELAARIRSVVRRQARKSSRRWVGPWLVDLAARTVLMTTKSVDLTRGEFDLLAGLIVADGDIVTREKLSELVSPRSSHVDLRSVDVLISRMRRKLGQAPGANNLILSAPGLGYRLSAPASPA